LILAALTPLMESFDRWDNDPGPVSDTEIHLTAWFVGVGIVLTFVKRLRFIPYLASLKERLYQSLPAWAANRTWTGNELEPTGSPPLIPLRI
jgi:hypothetical protein